MQAGLADEDMNPDLGILEQQRMLKARAREAKAARQLAKGNWAACTLHVKERVSLCLDLHVVFYKVWAKLWRKQKPRPKQVKAKGNQSNK